MKKLFYILSIIPVLALGQSTDQNFVKTTTYKQATATSNPNPDIDVANVQVNYFDGLGRPIQQVAHKQSNSGKDIVTHIEYDQFGRQTRDYLPYVSTGASLNYLPSAQTDLLNFYANPNATQTGNLYFEATGNPFSEKQLESSPLNRVFKQAAPGDAWGLPQTTGLSDDRSIKFDYQTNDNTDDVKLFTVTAIWNASKGLYDIPTSLIATTYADNQLYKTITKDENWKAADGKNNTTEEFKDKEGKVVLKRTYNIIGSATEKHDTYYIYDQFGNLTYVIPPLAEGNASQTNLDNLGYQYKYDSRNRLVEKKLPGKEWEYIVYDKLDRVVATGPTYSPFIDDTNIGWLITKYDAFSRVVYTGWYSGHYPYPQGRKEMQDLHNNQVTINENIGTTTINYIATGYTNVTFPTAGFYLLTINYYDRYNFPGGLSAIPTSLPDSTFPITSNVKGLPTGSWIRVLTSGAEFKGETSYTLYDNKYRAVRTKTTNFLGGYTEVDSKIDWAGRLQKTVTKHKYNTNATVLTTTETFTYSPQDKLVLHKHKINTGNEELLSKNNYDELGQLIKKEIGGTDFTGANSYQKIDYKYNIRGWLKEINNVDTNTDNDLFAFKINYNDGTTPLYNGNISETFWRSNTDNLLRKYEYSYDKLNRLLEANYSKPGDPLSLDSYREKIEYDKNGNITLLNRNGDLDSNNYTVEIDDLEYFYHPQKQNQLMKVIDDSNNPQGFKDDNDGVVDNGDDYEYDNFGNLTKDFNKEITNIKYNYLNLPSKITFVNGNSINYIYNAIGQKVQKNVIELTAQPKQINYMLGGFQYTNNVLNFFPHAEGYIDITTGLNGKKVLNYVYQYKDHLGNVRLSFKKNDLQIIGQPTQFTVLEENHYYPFGLKHTGYNTNTVQGNYKYKYNGKEYQDELGLNMYDYGARNYDPALGRWMNIDPLAQKYESISPYDYVGSNPVVRIDPDGMDWYTDSNGNYTYDPKLTKDNASERLKDIKGAKYFGSSGTHKVHTVDADGNEISVLSNHSLNADGSVTNLLTNKKLDTGSSFTDVLGNKINVFDDRPAIAITKNGELFSSNDGHDYMLFDNNWLQIETQSEYDNRIKNFDSNGKHHRAVLHSKLPRGSSEKNAYVGQTVARAGVSASIKTTTATGIIEHLLERSLKLSPIGVIAGYMGGQISEYDSMLKRMEDHDKNVDEYRNRN